MNRIRRGVQFLIFPLLMLAACEPWEKTSSEPVEAQVTGKYQRKLGRYARGFYLTVQYDTLTSRLWVEYRAYRKSKVGDSITVCLTQYRSPKANKRKAVLKWCPADR